MRAAVTGDVSFQKHVRGIYATDASNYQIWPVGVLLPRTRDDVRAAMRIAHAHGVPVLARGAGTSLSGQTVARALVIDFSKYMNRILACDPQRRRVEVEPGIVLDELNAAMAKQGLYFAPDPATGTRANIGGMIANNSAGARSLILGKTSDHVLALDILLADGTELHLEPLSAGAFAERGNGTTREAAIYRGVRAVVEREDGEIRARFPKVMRHVGGYALDAFIDTATWDLSKLMCGSEGTLGVVLGATLNLTPLPGHTALCAAHFQTLAEGLRAVEPLLALRPASVDLVDRLVLQMARKNLTTAPMCAFVQGDPAVILYIECLADTPEAAARQCRDCADLLTARGMGYAYPILASAAEKAGAWAVRKKGLGLVTGMRGRRKPLSCIEDAAIPVAHLPAYVEDVIAICREQQTELTLYGHPSVGVLHLKPILDLNDPADVARMKIISDRTLERVMAYGGALSAEHGDGLQRSAYNERFFGSKLYAAFQEIKTLFDPDGLLNPGKIVNAPPMDHDLRHGPPYRRTALKTWFHYRKEGSFVDAVEMCNGVGECRKTLNGTMCPSYMATRDEEHSTRGRANALRLAISGQLGEEGLTSKGLHKVLSLCLACKACKSECPSNVDMSRLKSEFLQMYRDRHGVPLLDRMVASMPRLSALVAGPLAPLLNRLQAGAVGRAILGAIGFSPKRNLPAYARQSLRAWARSRPKPDGTRPRVALFADTYLNAYEPELGRAACALLEALGYAVEIVFPGCCQRTRISKGFLREARADGEKTLRNLDPLAREGVKIVVCEPSCASSLTDDLPDLVDDEALGRRVAACVMPIEHFVADALDRLGQPAPFVALSPRIVLHGHCHQKALYGTAPLRRIFGAVAGVELTELDAGCCGMAGAFGYERQHIELSEKVGERKLFPAVRSAPADALIVASGFSCRHQIEHFTGRRAVHWIQALRCADVGGQTSEVRGRRDN